MEKATGRGPSEHRERDLRESLRMGRKRQRTEKAAWHRRGECGNNTEIKTLGIDRQRKN